MIDLCNFMKLFGHFDLIGQFNRDEKTAFNRIYSKYYSLIFRFTCRFTQNSADAEDITSETFLKLLSHRPHFENERKFKAYLFISAKRGCLDYIKRIRRQGKNEKDMLPQEMAEIDSRLEWAEEKAELHDRIRRAIDALPSQCRAVFLLYFTEHLQNSEIAARLKISEKTVANHRSDAIKRLGISLQKMHRSTIPVFMAASCYVDYLYHFICLITY